MYEVVFTEHVVIKVIFFRREGRSTLVQHCTVLGMSSEDHGMGGVYEIKLSWVGSPDQYV